MILSLIIKVLAKTRISLDEHSSTEHMSWQSITPLFDLWEHRNGGKAPIVGPRLPEYVRDLLNELGTEDWDPGAVLQQQPAAMEESRAYQDRCFGRLYAVDPDMRRKLILQEISGLRMLWSLSTRQRARRLHTLVKHAKRAEPAATRDAGPADDTAGETASRAKQSRRRH